MSSTDRRTDSDGDTPTPARDAWLPTTTPVLGGLLVLVVLVFFGLLTALSGLGGGMMGGGMMGGGMGGGMVASPWLWLPLFVPPIVGFAVLLYTLQRRSQSGSTPTDAEATADPLEILEARYLDDEIDLAEYETRLGKLFDLDADGDSHPRVSRLAIQYARGEINRETLTGQLERLRSADDSVGAVDTETVVESAAALDRQDTHGAAASDTEQSSPTARLRRRYADGEVSHEEYKQRLTTLRETASEET
ncbi:SHOCT domain-containing protein [Halonotius aquaticus]|nr:SHOCT domain-containing protein [Halonotius aquaticus]